MLELYKQGGEAAALQRTSRRRSILHHCVAPELEADVAELTVEQPVFGDKSKEGRRRGSGERRRKTRSERSWEDREPRSPYPGQAARYGNDALESRFSRVRGERSAGEGENLQDCSHARGTIRRGAL